MVKPGRFYVPLDVNWYDEWGHQVSSQAALLWVLALGQAKQMNSSTLPKTLLNRIAPDDMTEADIDRAVKELIGCESPPISGDDRAIVLHGFDDWNDQKTESQSGVYGNHIRWHVNAGKNELTCEYCQAIAPESPPISPPDRPPTSHPIAIEKSRVEKSRVEKSRLASPKKTKTSAPEHFEITEKLQQWVKENGFEYINLENQTQLFLDHHAAKGSTYTDWNRAWQTWIRNRATWDGQKSTQARDVPMVARGADPLIDDDGGERIYLPGEAK